MRVFQLNTFCGVKSTGRIACEIAKLVEADGGKCRIGYGVPGISADSERFAYRIGTPLERKLHAVSRKLLDAEGYGSYLGTQKLIEEIKNFQPDLIQLHNLHGCYLHLDSLFSFLAKLDVPVVWTLHDCWPFTGHCAYFDYSHCDRWKTHCKHCPQQKNYPACIGLDGSVRNYNFKKECFTRLKNMTFVAPCEWMLRPFSESYLRDYPTRVIYNGVNRDVFHPQNSDLRSKWGIGEKKLCLAVASEWDERKGLRFMIRLASQMPNTCFAVLGLLPQMPEVIPPNLLLPGSINSTEELVKWYSTADCLINPTLEDNMPMVNLEALASGTPVITFATGGCPEAVDESSGIVVPQSDFEALCAAVQSVDKPKMTEACLLRANKFDAQTTFRAYLDLYKELCL